MGILVNAAIAALAGSVGAILAATVVSSTMSIPFGLVFGLLGFFLSKQLVPAEAEPVDDYEARQAKKELRKKKQSERAQREREQAQQEAEEEAARKAAEKAAKKKKQLAAKKKAAVVESDSEEEEEEVDVKKLSKSAAKKAKAKAKAAAAAGEAVVSGNKQQQQQQQALTEAQKKKEKEKAKAKAKAEAEKAAKAEAKLRAAVAADTEGWNTIESTKPQKKITANNTAVPTSSSTSSGKQGKQSEVPSSERPLTIELIVPTKQHALIIGPKGATLQQIMSGSGAQVDMPKRESASSKINITGTPAQVSTAKNAIESLVERGFSNLTHPGILSDDLTVDPKQIGVILGKNASTLKQIQEKTKTRINLPDKGTSAKTAKITIVGAKDDVKQAKQTLKQLITDGFSPLTHEGYVKVDIVFPKEKLGLLIGPNGQTIKSIQGNTKTRINIPDKTSSSQYVSVVGLPAGVTQAEKEILRLLEPPAPIPDPEEEDLATDDAWGQQHTAQGEDALWE